MAISVRDRKILWARSGNQCAFPGCTQELVQHGSDLGPDVVVGDEAHIIAQAKGGRDEYNNLILLCPTHHRIIDAQPDVYMPAVLYAIKSQHESHVRAVQRSQALSLADV